MQCYTAPLGKALKQQPSSKSSVVCRAASSNLNEKLGFQEMRRGVKVASDETILTPRFYTTDFDEMEELFSREMNPNLDEAELKACLEEFR